MQIKLKIEHTYRVAKLSKKIAESLELKEEDIKLAELIGLLHDIGRFEQVKRYNTFRDSITFDHGDYGVKILFENGLIREFVEDSKYDEIIYRAVKNHNKYKIEDNLKERELLHSKIVRDADKTDIFFVYVNDIEKKINRLHIYEELKYQKVTPKVYYDFLKNKQSTIDNFKNEKDHMVNIISFIYDYNFKKGLEIVKENNYIERIIDGVFDKDNEMSEIKQKALEYVNRYLL